MERGFIQKFTDAVLELRDPIPTKVLGDIGIERKSLGDRPNFGQAQTGWWYDSLYYSGWTRDRVNYRSELGRLDNCSLVMAVVNWTGINLAEALFNF